LVGGSVFKWLYGWGAGLELGSVQLMVDGMGRSTGEAYVQFNSKAAVDNAMNRDRATIGHRWGGTGGLQFGGASYNNVPSISC
jgi:hypothetical protein